MTDAEFMCEHTEVVKQIATVLLNNELMILYSNGYLNLRV